MSQISLKWNHHHSTLVSVFSLLRDKELFCDTRVVCGKMVFGAHRVVLAASSPYFENILSQHSLSDGKDVLLILQDVNGEDFELLMQYMYRGQVLVEQTDLARIFKLAEKLKIRGLMDCSTAELEEKNRTLFQVNDKPADDDKKETTKDGVGNEEEDEMEEINNSPKKEKESEVEETKEQDDTMEEDDIKTEVEETRISESAFEASMEEGSTFNIMEDGGVPLMISKIVSLANIDQTALSVLNDDSSCPSDPLKYISDRDIMADIEAKECLDDSSFLEDSKPPQTVEPITGDLDGSDDNSLASSESASLLPAPSQSSSSSSILPTNKRALETTNSTSNLARKQLRVVNPAAMVTKTPNQLSCNSCRYVTQNPNLFSIHMQFCKTIKSMASASASSSNQIKPFKCGRCLYSARTQSALNYHLKTHSGIKPFVCNLCSYSTIIRRSLVVHMRTHTQEKPFACTFCPYRANQKSNLDSHMTSRHLKHQRRM